MPPMPGTALTRGISASGFGAATGGEEEGSAVNERGLYFWLQGRLFVARTGQGDPGSVAPRFTVGERRGFHTVPSPGSSPHANEGGGG